MGINCAKTVFALYKDEAAFDLDAIANILIVSVFVDGFVFLGSAGHRAGKPDSIFLAKSEVVAIAIGLSSILFAKGFLTRIGLMRS